jgi:cold shock CspA family protein
MTKLGRVKAVIYEKSFGFLVAAGVDYFFHRDDCESDAMFAVMNPGDVVKFEVQLPAPLKGPRGRQVRYPDPAPTATEQEGGEATIASAATDDPEKL